MAHTPRKRFGQNFLHDPGVIGKIIAAIQPHPGEKLVEIGPGRGAITLPLLAAAEELTVIELDRDLIEPLKTRCKETGKLNVFNADALGFDFCRLSTDQPVRIAGAVDQGIGAALFQITFDFEAPETHVLPGSFVLGYNIDIRKRQGKRRGLHNHITPRRGNMAFALGQSEDDFLD